MPEKPKLSENLVRVSYPDHRLDLYRQAARDVLASNSGDERYVIGIFGPDLIGSWALAFDPYKQFHNNTSTVSLLTDGPKIVRTRSVLTQPRSNRKEVWKRTTITTSYINNPDPGLFDYIYTGPFTETTTGTVNRAQQEPLYGTIIDTTRRTRPIKKDKGEFELFAPKLKSVPRTHAFLRLDQLNYNSIGSGQRATLRSWTRSTVTGPEFFVTNSGVQAMLPNIRLRSDAAMQKNVLGMLDNVQPTHRTYDLFYQIAELRELPLTLRSSLDIWRGFERIIGTSFFRQLQQNRFRHLWRNPQLLRTYARQLGHSTGFNYDELQTVDQLAASAFLSFKFGWESTWRAVDDFLPSPKRVTADVNRLVKAIGTDSSRRTTKRWIEAEASFPPLISIDFMKDESVVSSSVQKEGSRSCELRLMVNMNIQFPHLDLPRLRRELFREKMGAFPSASDIYNLVPWTWIVDWFGGLGDYISLMGSIANNRSLINYGFITYREVSKSTATMRGQFTQSISRNIDGVHADETIVFPYLHTGRFEYVYQRRRSIPTLANVREYWGGNLNPNQTAILGALASTRSGSLARRDVS